MPQIKSQFSKEERLAFENKYEIGVYSHEALIEILMIYWDSLDNLNNSNQHGESISYLLNRVTQLEERLMEVAGNIHEWNLVPGIQSLADKWK